MGTGRILGLLLGNLRLSYHNGGVGYIYIYIWIYMHLEIYR